MATEWRQVRARYWSKWLIGRLIRPKWSWLDGLRLVLDGQQNSEFAQRRYTWYRVPRLTLKEAAEVSGAIGEVLLVLGYDGKVGKRRPGPHTAKVKVALGDQIWWVVDVKTEQFEYLFVTGLPDDSEAPAQEETA